MRYGTWVIFVLTLAVTVIVLIKLPILVTFLIILPVLTFFLVYGSFLYNFRPSLMLRNVPGGYTDRTRKMDQIGAGLEPLGFTKIDQFFLKAIPSSVTYVFKHNSDPFYFCIYHLGKKMTFDVITRYTDGFTLTTANTLDAGHISRPPKALLQIFPEKSYPELVDRHGRGHKFILEQGIKPDHIPEINFRRVFFQAYHKQGEYIRKSLLWPLKVVYEVMTKQGREYCLSVMSQYPQGFARIWDQPGLFQ